MAEIRLDLCPLSEEDIETLFSSAEIPLVATCHGADLKVSEARLRKAIEAGAAFVDIDLGAPAPVSKRLSRLAYDRGTTVIRSWHDFSHTPDTQFLADIYDRAKRFGADIAKIITTGNSAEDWQKILPLYENANNDLISFCMSAEGSETRVECLAKGAPFSYAALSDAECTAPGQLTTAQMRERLYGAKDGREQKPFESRSAAPCSKSFAQRAIIAAALAEGTSHLRHYSPCDDSESAIRVAQENLGAKITREPDRSLTIVGGGVKNLEKVNVGESGLLARLMIPLTSSLGSGIGVVSGERTLPGRPLSGASDIMAAFGVLLEGGAGKDPHIPVTVSGKMLPGKAEIEGKGGSQLISGLLMSLPMADKDSLVVVNEPKSIPYMFITLDVLRKFGVTVDNEMEGDEDFLQTRDWTYCTGINFRIKGGQVYKAADLDLEGDWSAAANALTAGAVFGSASVTGLDSSSLQADLTIMDVLVEAGACVSEDEDGTINASKAPLRPFEIDLNNAPDIFPIVSVLAAFCPGTSRITGLGRLRGKESDRAAAITQMLTQMGVPTVADGDVLCVEGESLTSRLASGRLLRGGEFTSHHDHRMVMALKVAALGAKEAVLIDDEDCIHKSVDSLPEELR